MMYEPLYPLQNYSKQPRHKFPLKDKENVCIHTHIYIMNKWNIKPLKGNPATCNNMYGP